MDNKTLLILGMGHSQVDLAIAAREYGANVYACAKNPYGPARKYLDGCAEVDILDIDEVVNYAKHINADAIYTVGLEIAIDTIAKASERLGLYTFVTPQIFKKMENKIVWRQTLSNIPGNLKFTYGSTLHDLEHWDVYPAILKPADGSGQRGVIKVNNLSEIEVNFTRSLSYSKSKAIILEEFARGDEISVNSFMHEGELKFFIMSDRISHQEVPGGIIKEHHIPSKYSNKYTAEKAYQLVEDVNQAMGFLDGHIYFQLKIDQGDVSLIEFTPRFDGCHMWRLIKTSTGLDLLQVTLEKLLDGSSDTLDKYEGHDLIDRQYSLKFNSDKSGKVVDYKNYFVHPDATYTYWYYKEGEIINAVTNIIEKVGYYIFSTTNLPYCGETHD